MDEDNQLSFDALWKELEQAKALESQPKLKEKVVRVAVKKQVRKTPAKPIFEVSLTHEDGVDWRLDCLQTSKTELDAGYYDHLACEALKLELLKMLKRSEPVKMEVYMISLVLCNFGVDVPEYLRIDANKNLLEYDLWGDFGKSSSAKWLKQSSSYLWAFYFSDFAKNYKLASRSFTEYPAEETDISFLVDYEIASSKYQGLAVFVD